MREEGDAGEELLIQGTDVPLTLDQGFPTWGAHTYRGATKSSNKKHDSIYFTKTILIAQFIFVFYGLN